MRKIVQETLGDGQGMGETAQLDNLRQALFRN